MIARDSYSFPPLATLRYRGRFIFALAGMALSMVWLVTLSRRQEAVPLADFLLAWGALVVATWFAWRATVVYQFTYSGVTISRAGLVIAKYSWADLREWCHDWTLDEHNTIVTWLWLRFTDGRRWTVLESLGSDFRDLRNHLAIHFDGQRRPSTTLFLARFWP